MRYDGADHLYAAMQQWVPNGSEMTQNYVYPGRRSRSDLKINAPDARGFRSPSGYVVNFVNMSQDDTVLKYRSSAGAGAWGWDTTPFYDPQYLQVNDMTALPVDLSNQLKTRCLLQIKDQKINLALSLAFARETADMIYMRALQMAKIYDALRERNLPKARRILRRAGYPIAKRLSDNILEYQYGWRQLAADIMGATQELDRGLRREHEYLVARVSQKETVDMSRTITGNYMWYYVGNFTFSCVAEHAHRCSMWFEVNCNWSNKLSQLGLLNPAEAVADAVPFSFAVNWVWPIVDYLSTVDATVGLTYKGGAYTRLTQCEGGSFRVVPGKLRDYPVTSGSSQGELQWFRMVRKVVDDSVHPFYLTNPFAGSLQRALNALALLGQRAGGTRR